MENELEDTFRRGMEAFSRADVDAALEVVHPEIEFIPARAAMQGSFHGHEGMRRFFADNEENFDLFHATYPDIRRIDDDRMVALGSVRTRGRSSGVETEVPSAVVLDFREGKLVRFEDLGDERRAMTMARSRD